MNKIGFAALALVCLLTPCRALATETAEPADTVESVEAEWYHESVSFCAERGIIKLNESIPFDPDALLSKIEFIAMVSRAYGLYDEGDQPFYLAKDGHYAAKGAC